MILPVLNQLNKSEGMVLVDPGTVPPEKRKVSKFEGKLEAFLQLRLLQPAPLS